MKTATTAMKGHLQGDVTKLCRLYLITRKDGNVFTFTDADHDLDTTAHQTVFTDGGYVYEAVIGFSPTASEGKSDLSVDNQEVTAFIDSSTIKETDIRYGVWDAADVEIRVCNWADLTQGEIKVRKGATGNMIMKNGIATFEILGLTNKLQILQGRSYGPTCDAELGDSRCKVVVPTQNGSVNTTRDAHTLAPNAGLTGAAGFYSSLTSGHFVVPSTSGVTNSGQSGTGTISSSGTVLAITDVANDGAYSTYTFTVTSGPAPRAGQSIVITGMTSTVNNGTYTINEVGSSNNSVWTAGYYDDGIMTFTSGVNSGLSFQIRQWDGTTLKLCNALFVPPAHGDTFTISPGCAHNTTDCHGKFNNLPNFRGFEAIPGQDSILQYPDSKG